MTRRLLAIAAAFGVLAVACGKYGPPVRPRSDPAATSRSETAAKTGDSAAEAADEEEQQP